MCLHLVCEEEDTHGCEVSDADNFCVCDADVVDTSVYEWQSNVCSMLCEAYMLFLQ